MHQESGKDALLDPGSKQTVSVAESPTTSSMPRPSPKVPDAAALAAWHVMAGPCHSVSSVPKYTLYIIVYLLIKSRIVSPQSANRSQGIPETGWTCLSRLSHMIHMGVKDIQYDIALITALLPKSTSNTSDAMHPSPSCLCWKSQGFTKASGHCHDIAPLPKQRAARRLLAVHGEAFARYAGYAASPISNVLAGPSWLGHLILRYVI